MCARDDHLSCLGMKEGVGMMKRKVFVCHFCVSACLLVLQKEVGLREELHSVRVELKEMKEENRRLKYEVEQERCEQHE